MELKKIKAKDVMIKELITIGPEEKIALADLIMARSSIGGLPVVDRGKLVGIITQRDIMLARNYEIGGLMTRDLMSKNLITVGPEASLKEILEVMLDKKIERIPVVENGKLVGLIVHNRVLRAIYESLA
ncbi:MAG: CBS domain-containing protein [Euryarchaeota archaeon]|nr:CBS domain-containing protein [Euryarchaeota archaeon]